MSFYQQYFDIQGLEIRGIVRNVTSQDAVFIVSVEMPIIRCWELFSGSYFNPIILPVPCLRWWQWNKWIRHFCQVVFLAEYVLTWLMKPWGWGLFTSIIMRELRGTY